MTTSRSHRVRGHAAAAAKAAAIAGVVVLATGLMAGSPMTAVVGAVLLSFAAYASVYALVGCCL